MRVRALLLLWIALVFAALWTYGMPAGAASAGVRFVPPAARPVTSGEPYLHASMLDGNSVRSVHSCTLVELSGGRLRAFWYGGSREGALDVAIYTAVYDPAVRTWSRERALIDRANSQDGLQRCVQKLGNSCALLDSSGKLWLFFVTSMTGWSGSSINVTTSPDEGETWTPPRRLVTSPFLNLSTLVRSPPFQFADGTIGLPVYHEFLSKFCELLRLDGDANVLSKQRLTQDRLAIQPAIVPFGAQDAVCLMRPTYSSPKRVIGSRTTDGGRTWSEAAPLGLTSDRSGVAGVRMPDGGLLAAARVMRKLTLSVSRDQGTTWQTVAHASEGLVAEDPNERTTYPCLLLTKAGEYHLVFTYNRREIRHMHFNQAWLDLP